MAKSAAESVPPPAPPRPHGGRRKGSGRKPGSPRKLKATPAFVSLTDGEKARLEREAERKGLTLSYYLRLKLGLPIT
jgi:hypothetical protein